MKVRLVRLRGGQHSRLNKPIVGQATQPPMVGYRFEITGTTLFGNFPHEISTSPVSEVLSEGRFRTVGGSLYQIKVLDQTWN